MASVLSQLWPGILGAAATGIVVYLSLRGVSRTRRELVGREWHPELSDSTGQEPRTADA